MTLSGLIHEAYVLRSSRTTASRNSQGQFTDTPAQVGATFRARLMLVSLQNTRSEAGANVGDTAEEIVRKFEFLTSDVDDDGNPVTITASDRLQFTDAGPLGTPLIDVSGEAELLNNGRHRIGYWGFGVIAEDVGSA